LNAHLERFLGALKSDCLERMIFFGENMLRKAIRQFLELRLRAGQASVTGPPQLVR